MLYSCKQKEIDSSPFDFVDVSIYNGWTDFYSLKVLNNGKTYILNDKLQKGIAYYTLTLNQTEIDSLTSLIKLILDSRLDTLYNNSCVDCGRYNLIIQTKNKTFSSFVNGIQDSPDLNTMNELTDYLYKIAEKGRKSLDSTFIFKSRTRWFFPPPPPPDYLLKD